MTRIVLDWPPDELSPNVKAHWAVKGRATKRYRADAYVLTRAQNPPKMSGPIKVKITYHQRKRGRSVDETNVINWLKAGFDGIADALGVDDNCFELEKPIRGERTKFGCVIVELEAA